MKAWLKGGLIFASLYLVISIILFSLPCDDSGGLFSGGTGGSCLGIGVLILFTSSPGLAVLNLFGIDTQSRFLLIFVTTIGYFIIGSAIGWVIGKLKSKTT